ncbi:MAG: nickel pincer cofactor biosynthesis protein LarC [Deltaproteobacteria bacterium]|nr:nickel pincer cofactor biosynthesis protein LarC [Deltaproteobacteria bacterium]
MIAYFDCFSGISGDMTLGAFTDLGVPVDFIRDEIRENLIDGFDIRIEKTSVNGISATDVNIIIDENTGHKRDYSYIKNLIEESSLSENVKKNSLEMFKNIAVAESKIHNADINKIHFHEVGSVDSIVDIVGTCLCLENLDIKKVYSSKISTGSGFVKCSHGVIPVPAPATLEILKGVPLIDSGIKSELVTPTGAAIIKTLATSFGGMELTPEKTGYGSGKKRFAERPNLLRIILAKEDRSILHDRVAVIETVIDDMNPEIFGYLIEKLLKKGALDVYYTPVFMKKNRPATKVTVISDENIKKEMIDLILTETTSIGVRYKTMDRSVLEREIVLIETSLGKISFKKIKKPDDSIVLTPEYEECKKLAVDRNIPLKQVYDLLTKETNGLY